MAIHTFICDECSEILTDTTSKGEHKCPKCGKTMWWDMRRFMSGGGDFYHESRAMGCTANQVNEMRKLYPGSEYKKRGKNYVLVTRSAKEMDQRLQERGMVKFTQGDLKRSGDI